MLFPGPVWSHVAQLRALGLPLLLCPVDSILQTCSIQNAAAHAVCALVLSTCRRCAGPSLHSRLCTHNFTPFTFVSGYLQAGKPATSMAALHCTLLRIGQYSQSHAMMWKLATCSCGQKAAATSWGSLSSYRVMRLMILACTHSSSSHMAHMLSHMHMAQLHMLGLWHQMLMAFHHMAFNHVTALLHQVQASLHLAQTASEAPTQLLNVRTQPPLHMLMTACQQASMKTMVGCCQ